MSIKDSTGASKSFALISQNGFDRQYAGLDTAYPTIIVEKQTRSTAAGKQNSNVVTVVVTVTDAETGEVLVHKANLSQSFPNKLVAASAPMRDALLFATRLVIGGADDLSGVPGSAETNLDAATRGVLPTP